MADDLVKAAANDCPDKIKAFLEEGAPVDSKADDGGTALIFASSAGHVEAARLLLEAGADPTASLRGRSALCRGARSTEMTRLFLDRDLLKDLEDSCAYIHAYSAFGDAGVLRDLIALGLDIEKTDHTGRPALHEAMIYDNYPAVQALLEAGADADKKASPISTRTSLIHLADPVETCLLVQHGADLNVRDTKGETPLMWAADLGLEEKARLLLEEGADPDLQDSQGRTALMHALTGPVQLQHSRVDAALKNRVAVALLDGGADPRIEDNQGRTALEYATMNGHDGISAILRERLQ